jgi:hypothetical protein
LFEDVAKYSKIFTHRAWHLITIWPISSARTFAGEVVTVIDATVAIRTWVVGAEVHLE